MALSTEHKLYISVGVLAVLGGALYFQHQKQQAEAVTYSLEGRAAELPKIEFTEEDTKKIDKIVISRREKDAGTPVEVVLEKEGEDDWKVTKPVEYKANKSNVTSLLNSLERLKVNEMIASGKESYGEFGLTDDEAVHAVVYQGKEVKADLYFGDGGSRGQMTRVAGRDGVFAVKGYSSYSFTRDVKTWRDQSIFEFDEKKVASVDLKNEHGTYVFVREEKPEEAKPDDKQKDDADKKDKDKKKKKDDKKHTWTAKAKVGKAPVAKGIERFKASKVDDMLRAFKKLNATGFEDEKSAADLGLDEPVATLTITLKDGGKRVLLVGQEADGSGRWVKTPDGKQIFSVSSYVGNWTTAEPEKFQEEEKTDEEKKAEDKAAAALKR